ncbi:MAG: sulfite exporter TauE/SafE family protein [Rhodospirillaceae bacterium]|nr:sulfite exporter TauE/SafE family protein [Rhodospirillaceae bacterium]
MDIHLPIANLTVDVLLLLGLGGVLGVLSGVFGVGGGFLVSPLLILIGVPAPVAVASGSMMVLGSSVSGVMAHLRRGNVDFKMGAVLIVGGALGSALGAWFFQLLRAVGQIDLVVPVLYVAILGTVGLSMVWESVGTLLRLRRNPAAVQQRIRRRTWHHRLPLKMRFRKSKLYISALLPAGISFLVGVLSAVMGVGGGFVMVPAMIYLIGMPVLVVVGTSLLQITFVMANVTFLLALNTGTVDAVLALLLLAGAAAGAQFGTRLGARLSGVHLRILLALLVLGVAVRLSFGLVTPPESMYTVEVERLVQ